MKVKVQSHFKKCILQNRCCKMELSTKTFYDFLLLSKSRELFSNKVKLTSYIQQRHIFEGPIARSCDSAYMSLQQDFDTKPYKQFSHETQKLNFEETISMNKALAPRSLDSEKKILTQLFFEREGSGDIHFGTFSILNKCFNFHNVGFPPKSKQEINRREKQLILLLTYYTITIKSKSGFVNETMVLLLPG